MKALLIFFKTIRLVITSVLLCLISYTIIAYFGSSISTSSTIEEQEIDIYILSNGVHTDIVVPTTTNYMDWSLLFPFENTTGKEKSLKHLALGWGNKGFYLETPTWNDLKFSTAFDAVFGLSESAIHATYHKTITSNNKNCFKISISKRQYSLLCQYIKQTLKLNYSKSQHIKTNANYGLTDAFYEANGAYNLFYTCNTWANNALKSCEQKAALWTPFDKGILKHYKK